MLIRSKTKSLIKKYERPIFFSEEHSKHDKIYSLYLLIRPIVEWIVPELKTLGLNKDEIESELFILCADIFNNYDKSKSSIIPYLENQIPWFITKMLNKIKKYNSTVPQDFEISEGTSYINEEYYWNSNILFCNKYVGKYFTRSQKYLIYIILTSDDKELSQIKLANTCKVERKRIVRMLNELKDILKKELKWVK